MPEEIYYHIYVTDSLDLIMSGIKFQREGLEKWVLQRFGRVHEVWEEENCLKSWENRPVLKRMLRRLDDKSHVMVTRIHRFDTNMKRLADCVEKIAKKGATLHILNFADQPLSLAPKELFAFGRIFRMSWEIQQAHLYGQPQTKEPWKPAIREFTEKELNQLRRAWYEWKTGMDFKDVLRMAYRERWRTSQNTNWVYKGDLTGNRSIKGTELYRAVRSYAAQYGEECERLMQMPRDLMIRFWT